MKLYFTIHCRCYYIEHKKITNMKIKEYAPVIIPTLCRYEHFVRCVESLRRCSGAEHTTLIIGLDYPLYDSHKIGYDQICKYIPTIYGFKEVIVHKREYNYGPSKNIKALYAYVYSISDRCIYSEDDNEFSPNFLEYINKGLELYKDNPHIVGISGYNYIFIKNDMNNDAYPCVGFSAWGCGLWRDKHMRYEDIGADMFVKSILNSWKKSFRIFKSYPTWLNACLTMFFHHRQFGDHLMALECLLYNKVTIYPRVSKVRNWGNDGTGVNCKKNIYDFQTQQIDDKYSFEYNKDVLQQPPIHIASYMKVSFIKRVVVLLRYVWYRMTGKDLFNILD